MERLSRDELAEIESTVSRWQTPQELAARFSRYKQRSGQTVFFNQPGLAILRDTYVASAFAGARDADRVRVIPDEWPDFEIELDGRVEQFEAVQADNPARRIGEEYRNDDATNTMDPVEDWVARAEVAPKWLSIASRKKTRKRYTRGAGLVIYLVNADEYGIRHEQVVGSFLAATSEAKDQFESVWVLWKGQAYPVWIDGRPAPGNSFRTEEAHRTLE